MKKRMKSKKKEISVMKAGIWFTLCNIIQRGIQFIVTPLYTRILLTEEYGRYSTFLTWCNLLAVIATLSLSNGVFNKAMSKYEDRDGYLASMVGLSLFTTVITVIVYICIYPFCGKWIGLTALQSALMFLCIYFQMIIQLWTARLRYEYRFIGVLIVTFIFALLIPGLGITFYFVAFQSEMGLIVGYTMSNVLVGGVLLVTLLPRIRQYINWKYWKYALKFNVPLIPHYLASIVLGQSDRLMISYFCGDYFTGIYTLAYQISLVMSIVSTGIDNALTPWIYECINEEKWKNIKKKTNSIIVVSTIPFTFIMLIAPEFIFIMGSEKYRNAIYVIPPVVASSYLMFINTFIVRMLFYYEKNVNVMINTSIGAVLNVVLNLFFLSKVGYLAAAYTTVAGYIVILLLNFMSMRKYIWHIGEKIYNVKKTFLSIIFVFALCGISIELYGLSAIIRWILILVFIIFAIIKRKKLLII